MTATSTPTHPKELKCVSALRGQNSVLCYVHSCSERWEIQALVACSTPRHSASLRVSIRETKCERNPLWSENSYSVSWTKLQLGQNATVMLAKMPNSTCSCRDVMIPFLGMCWFFLQPWVSVYVLERAEIKHRDSQWSFPVPSALLEICGSKRGPGKKPGFRATTVHLAGCALDM